jgi:hypothetical protein
MNPPHDRRLLASALSLLLALAPCARPQQSAAPQTTAGASPPRVEAVAEPRAPAGWRRYRFGEPVLYSVILPRAPLFVPDGPHGDDLASFGYYAPSETAAYAVIYSFDAREGADRKTERQKRIDYNNFAAGFVDGLLKGEQFSPGARAQVLGERRVRLGGVEAFERDFALGTTHRGRLRSISVGPRSLLVSAVWLADAPPAERTAFFDSLTLEMARAAAPPPPPLAGWQKFEPPDGRFTAMLPTPPAEVRRPVASGEQTLAGVHYVSDSDDGYYVVGYLPDIIPRGARLSAAELEAVYRKVADEIFEGVRGQFASRGDDLGLTRQAPRPATVGGVAGREYAATAAGALEFRLQVALSGGAVFVVFAAWPLEATLATREAFLRSFRINARPAARPR